MNMACRKAFTEELLSVARDNKNVLAITSDARGSVTLNEFAKELPEQFIETGIAEQNEVGIAGGLAAFGKIPFVCAPAPFLCSRSYEQIKIDIAHNKRNVKLIGVSGGVSYGTLGASHQSLQDIAALRAIPDLTIIVPSDGVQTRALTRAISEMDGPVFMRMGRNAVAQIYEKGTEFTVGKAFKVRDGKDVTLLAVGEMVWICRQASIFLAGEGIEAGVLDMFSIKPFDTEAVIEAARKTGRLVTVEEHSVFGGLGGAVCEVTAQNCPVPIKIIGAPDDHIVSGESAEVFAYYGWTPEGIARSVKEWLASL